MARAAAAWLLCLFATEVVLIASAAPIDNAADYAVLGVPLPDEALYTPAVKTCLLTALKMALQSLVAKEPQLHARFLRIFFHDCASGGCNGSILKPEELSHPLNAQLLSTDQVPVLKGLLSQACKVELSNADTILLAAAGAVTATGGPDIGPVLKLGRRDSLMPDDPSKLPKPVDTAMQLQASLAFLGLTTEDIVALSGAHTLGQSTCQQFLPRVGGGPGMDMELRTNLSQKCHTFLQKVDFDPTATRFDNLYFKALEAKRGLLTSDQTLYETSSTLPFVTKFASDQAEFFDKFTLGFIKLSFAGVEVGPPAGGGSNAAAPTSPWGMPGQQPLPPLLTSAALPPPPARSTFAPDIPLPAVLTQQPQAVLTQQPQVVLTQQPVVVLTQQPRQAPAVQPVAAPPTQPVLTQQPAGGAPVPLLAAPGGEEAAAPAPGVATPILALNQSTTASGTSSGSVVAVPASSAARRGGVATLAVLFALAVFLKC